MGFPSPKEYLEAKKTAKKYEKRQRQLKALEEELSNKLFNFVSFKFKINKKKGEIIFAGYDMVYDRVKIGLAKKSSGDKYEPVIGKLIAVKKSLGEDINDVVKLVEKEENFILFNDGINTTPMNVNFYN